MDTLNPKPYWFFQLTQYLNSLKFPYVIVGDTRNIHKCVEGDIDIVIDCSHIPAILKDLIKFFAQFHVQLFQIIKHEQTAWFLVIGKVEEMGEPQFHQLDICNDYYRLGRFFLSAKDLVVQREESPFDGKYPGFFYVPSPKIGFIYYLLKRIEKCNLGIQNGEYLSSQWALDPLGITLLLRRYFESEADVLAITKAAANNSWIEVQCRLSDLRTTLRHGRPFSASNFWKELFRKWKRVCNPTGIRVGFLGPDGAGKSTILAQVARDLSPVFRRTKSYHLRPFFLYKNVNAIPVKDPHSSIAHNSFLSFGKVCWWWLDYSIGYLIDVFPRLVSSTLILFDRYYHDLLVDQTRYRYGGPLWFAKFVGNFIPPLDLIILLDAPTNVLLSRKEEVSISEIERQRSIYRNVIKGMRNSYSVNAEMPFDKVLIQVEKIILEFMADRNEKRLRAM